jgi:hypothetical protein
MRPPLLEGYGSIFFRYANEEHLALLMKGRKALYEDESTIFDSLE